MNREEQFLEWVGYMSAQTIYGTPKYNNDEVIDFEKYWEDYYTNEKNEERFKEWVDNDYSI